MDIEMSICFCLEVSEDKKSARAAYVGRVKDVDAQVEEGGNCHPILGFHSSQRLWGSYLEVLWDPWEGIWKLKKGRNCIITDVE